MLFRTVYGLELEAIYDLILSKNLSGDHIGKDEIYKLVLINPETGKILQSQAVDDALSFLSSAELIDERNGIRACFDLKQKSFTLHLLEHLTSIWRGTIEPFHPLDPLFMFLLSELFITPDRQFIANVYQEANQLKIVKEAGGLSKEKIQAWKRVLEYLGIGLRIKSGFLCIYNPVLIKEIINDWTEDQGSLQDFLEYHFNKYLPFSTKVGEISAIPGTTFKMLNDEGFIHLFPMQDSPSRFYFGDHKFRGITRKVSL